MRPHRAGPILVTGASGLLGSNCVLDLMKQGHQVVGCANRHPGQIAGNPLILADLADPEASDRLLREHHPSVVVHAAALTDVDFCEDRPDLADAMNRGVSARLAQACQEHGARLVLISTDAVYEGDTGSYAEDSPTGPVNAYARSKLEAERDVVRIAPNSLVLRTTIYGWNFLPKRSFGESIVANLAGGHPLTLFQDAYFSPLLVNDLVDLMTELMTSGITGIVNVGARDGISKLAFGRLIAEEFGYPAESIQSILTSQKQLRAPRPLNVTLNVEKLRRLTGHDSPSVLAGIQRFKRLLSTGYVSELKGIPFSLPEDLLSG